MDTRLGTLHTVDGRPVLRFERRLAHPPEKVWTAVSDPAEMSHWFPAAVDAELKIGASMRFSFGDDGIDLGSDYADGEILELDPPKVYAFRWVGDVLRFELVPDGSGCLLVFTASLSGRGTEGDRPSVARTAPGWDGCLDVLAARLDGGPAPQVDAAFFLSRAERYVEEFGLDEGEVCGTADGYLVRFERDLVQPPEQVWATLTDTDTDTDTGTAEPAVGSPPSVPFTNGYVPAGAITEVEPPRIMEYTWHHDGEPAGRVRFELRDQQPIGTRLVVTQTIPSSLAQLRATSLAAWQVHLELLFAALWGDVRCPWPAERTERLRHRYAGRLG